jgi:LytS/YehU family sensor histidine kinase
MVLSNSEKELIPLSSEIEMLELYLSLESLRFSKSFSYRIDVLGIADTDEIMIPSLITQPLVENAIWHGLRNKQGDKILTITYEEKNELILITVDDNGIGRVEAALIRQQKLGSSQIAPKGTMILQERFKVLTQHFKVNIQLETIDKKDEDGNPEGTTNIIVLPVNLSISSTKANLST